jgi:hypothetical protein
MQVLYNCFHLLLAWLISLMWLVWRVWLMADVAWLMRLVWQYRSGPTQSSVFRL